jgi:nucleoside-diphosphate-sugar epimerase
MTLQGKTVLVTGATGFLGGALTQRLTAEGAKVRALVRRPNRDAYIRDLPQLEIVTGDLTDAASLKTATENCDVVFHVAASIGGSLAHQRQANVEGTRNLALAAAQNGVGRFVHVSSIAVYGYAYSGDITEDLPPKPKSDPYNITKAEAETALHEVATAQGLPFTILRPGMIYGPRSGMWTRQMFQLARRAPAVWFGDGGGSAYPIHVEDVVSQMLIQATHPAALGQTFNATPDPSPTWREFLGAYSQLAGHDRWLGIPYGLLNIGAPIAEAFLRLMGEPRDVPLMARMIQRRDHYKMTRAKDLLNWQPQITLEQGIQSCAPWLREEGLL